MFLTKDLLAKDEMRDILETALLELNDRLTDKAGNDGDGVAKPFRLSLSLSDKGTNRVTAAICLCEVSPGVFMPRKCKHDGTCP